MAPSQSSSLKRARPGRLRQLPQPLPHLFQISSGFSIDAITGGRASAIRRVRLRCDWPARRTATYVVSARPFSARRPSDTARRR